MARANLSQLPQVLDSQANSSGGPEKIRRKKPCFAQQRRRSACKLQTETVPYFGRFFLTFRRTQIMAAPSTREIIYPIIPSTETS